jgi:hypothetical protein
MDFVSGDYKKLREFDHHFSCLPFPLQLKMTAEFALL